MQISPTALPGVLVLEPKVFGDDRGFFLESFNQQMFDKAVGHQVDFVQDNHSRSQRGVLRGLHYQLPPHAQGKLVRVARGAVFDVAVDMRRSSLTFGQWVGQRLDDVSNHQLWIPPGFAHGFLVLSDIADFLYKATAHYAPTSEASVRWDDPTLAIRWPEPGVALQLSAKDRIASEFKRAPTFE